MSEGLYWPTSRTVRGFLESVVVNMARKSLGDPNLPLGVIAEFASRFTLRRVAL